MDKKVQVLGVGLSLLAGFVSAEVCSIDSGRILQESREGRSIIALNEKDKKVVMDLEYEQSKKISQMREALENGMRTGAFTEEMMQEKYEEFGRAQRKAQHIIEDAREDFRIKEQKRVLSFRKKVHEIASELFSKDAAVKQVFDRSTPGMIYSSPMNDKTEELLKQLNARYEQEKAALTLTKAGNVKKDKKQA